MARALSQPSVSHIKPRDDDSLKLMSGGIAEARDAEGNLSGFERIEELLRATLSAAALATAAQEFGQGDDNFCADREERGRIRLSGQKISAP